MTIKAEVNFCRVFLAVVVSIVTAITLIFLAFNLRFSWGSREEPDGGPSIATCHYQGIWIRTTFVRIVVQESCSMI